MWKCQSKMWSVYFTDFSITIFCCVFREKWSDAWFKDSVSFWCENVNLRYDRCISHILVSQYLLSFQRVVHICLYTVDKFTQMCFATWWSFKMLLTTSVLRISCSYLVIVIFRDFSHFTPWLAPKPWSEQFWTNSSLVYINS